MVGYDPKLSANPFVAFEQIPPRSRYQFLLDNAQYMIMTFIHGPVCKGQIALNVIDDQFWVMFLDPDHDLSVAYPGFLKLHSEKLRMPIEGGSDLRIFSALTDELPEGGRSSSTRPGRTITCPITTPGSAMRPSGRAIGASDAPLLTIYRHFDSASVHKGVLGNLPKTLWVIDYPLFERIYYALVAGFDIYGTAGHQLAIRLYMDRLRIEGESYLLDFLPQERRQEIMQSWYKGVDLKKIGYYPSLMPADTLCDRRPETRVRRTHRQQPLLPAAKISFDPVNYLRAGADYPPLPTKYETGDFLQAFRPCRGPGPPFFSLVNDHNANLAYVRVAGRTARCRLTIVVNRWHDNVAFLIGEDARLDPSKDSADFILGLIGSYPNYFVDVREKDLPDFIDLLAHFDKSPQDLERLARYGINRADERFWDAYDWFQQRFNEDEPVRGGLFDLPSRC